MIRAKSRAVAVRYLPFRVAHRLVNARRSELMTRVADVFHSSP
jgi:hypothetical protein